MSEDGIFNEDKTAILAKPLEITPAMFDGRGVIELVDKLDKDLRSIVLDGSTPKGRQECISLAANVRSSKAHIDKVRAALVKPIKDRAKKIDEQGKEARDKLDALAVYLRQPATDWEAAEEKRITGHRNSLQAILALKDYIEGMSVLNIEQRINELTKYRVRDFEEYSKDAKLYIEGVTVALDGALAAAKQREEDAKELERLRKEKAEMEAAAAKAQEDAAGPHPVQTTPGAMAPAAVKEPEKNVQDQPQIVRNSREHCRNVHNAIVQAMTAQAAISHEEAQSLVRAIVMRKIPNTVIQY